MINTEDFIKRLEQILDYYGLNASSFADKIGVQRSSLSHLLSGRNKPSLDFVLKIMDVYPEVDLYWILNGKGNFPKSEVVAETDISSPTPFSDPKSATLEMEKQADLFSGNFSTEETQANIFLNSKSTSISKTNAEIDRIVIFYKNGTFKTYSSE